jgi:hypothetical protein
MGAGTTPGNQGGSYAIMTDPRCPARCISITDCPILDRLAAAVADGQRRPSASDLLAVVGQLSVPRKPRGRRHGLAVVLTLATCAVLAGARSFTAIGEWSADAGQTVAGLLGVVRVPEESTFRRVFTALDADAPDAALGAWAARRDYTAGQDAAAARRRRQDPARLPERRWSGSPPARRATHPRSWPACATSRSRSCV